MSDNTENTSNGLDMLKWLIVVLLLGGIVAVDAMYEQVSVLYRALGTVVVVILVGFIAATTAKGLTFINFAKAARIEIRKVIWPTRQEATQTTLIVLAAVVVMSLLLWLLDGIIVRLVSLITGVGV